MLEAHPRGCQSQWDSWTPLLSFPCCSSGIPKRPIFLGHTLTTHQSSAVGATSNVDDEIKDTGRAPTVVSFPQNGNPKPIDCKKMKKKNEDTSDSVSWLNQKGVTLLAATVIIFSAIVFRLATFSRRKSKPQQQPFKMTHKYSTRWFIPVLVALVLSPYILVSAFNITDLTVDSPVTWTAADNPISVSGKVEIVTDGILTLQEGVQVWFESAQSGIVNSGGTLLILGQPSAHVVLKPRSVEDGGAGTWQGISFGPLAVPALFVPDSDTIVQYQGGSIIQNADVIKAGATSNLAALDFEYGSTPYLFNVNLVECHGRADVPIWIDRLEGYFVADYVKLSKETLESTYSVGYGLMAYGVSPTVGVLLVRHFEASLLAQQTFHASTLNSFIILDSTFQGAVFYSVNAITFERNTISWSSYCNCVMAVNSCGDVTVRNSTMIGHAGFYTIYRNCIMDGNTMLPASSGSFGLSTDYVGDSGGSTIIRGNLIIAWETGDRDALQLNHIANNMVLADNEIRYGRLVFSDSWSYSWGNPGSVSIFNNVVRDSKIGGLYMSTYYHPNDVYNNTFDNCTTADSSIATIQVLLELGTIHFHDNYVVHSSSVGTALRLDCRVNEASACSFEFNVIEDTSAEETLIWFENYPWKFENNLFLNSTSPVSVLLGSSSRLTTKDYVRLPANYWGLLQADICGPRFTVSDAFALSVGPIVDFETVLTGPSTSSPQEAVRFPGGNLTDGTVGGLLEGNTSFVVPSGNFTCRLSFIVRDTATLVISAGVHLYFESMRGIILHEGGTIITKGNTTNPVILTNASASHWKGIVTNADVANAISNVEFRTCDVAVEHSGFGFLELENIAASNTKSHCVWSRSGDSSIADAILIRHSNFDGCGDSGIVIEQRPLAEVANTSIVHLPAGSGIKASSVSNMTIFGCFIDQVAGDGIRASYVSNMLVQECRVEEIALSGISAEHVTNMVFQACLVDQVASSGINAYDVSTMTVQESRIESVGSYALYVHYFTTYHIVGNVFSATQGGIFLDFCNYMCTVRIENNLIQGDFNARSGVYAIYFISYYPYADAVVIQNNQVEAWNLVDRAALDLQFSAADSPTAGLHVINNHFRNITASNILAISYYSTKNATNMGNIFGDSLEASSTSQPALVLIRNWPGGTDSSPTMHGNIFLGGLRNDTTQYYIQVLQADSVLSIDASRSFWGNDSEEVLADRIFDGQDESGLSTIQYLPVLLTPDLDGPVGSNETTLPFLREGGVISGILAADKTVTLTKGNYTCKRSLTIDGFLFVEAGVHIQMDYHANLVVRMGSLLVIGSVDDPVVFSRAEAGSWGQIKLEPNMTDGQDLQMVNVIITGAGFSSLPALHTQRASTLINISISESLDSGVAVDANFGLFVMQGVHLVHSGAGSYNLKISGSGDAFVKNSGLSSYCSVELAVFDSVRLFVANVDIHPKSYYHTGLYADNVFIDVEYLSYNASLSEGCAIQLTGQQQFEMRQSVVLFGSLGVQIGGTWCCCWGWCTSYGSFFFYDNTWIGHGSPGDRHFVLVYYTNSIRFEGNHFDGNLWTGRPITIYGTQNLVLSNNILEHFACQGDCLYFSGTTFQMHHNTLEHFACEGNCLVFSGSTFEMNNNTLERCSCQRDCLALAGTTIETKQNRFADVTVPNPYSFLKVDSALPSITDNRFQGISGYAGLELVAAPPSFNFTRNAWLNISSLAFYVKTTTLYENVVGGVYRIPGNFWDTDSFELLRSKTYDSEQASELATISHTGIYVDANFEIFLPPPFTTTSCVDLVSMTIACIISEEVTVNVPAGLYFAPRSIIVRHPNALLVFDAGTRVMFPPGASIRVDEGTFKALGTKLYPVVLTSTERFSVEYGNPSIKNWTEWGGIRLGQNSGSTLMVDDAYVDGPVLRDCVIENAGYGSNPAAAVYMNQVNVLLERVSIIGSGSNGVFFDGTLSPALLRDVSVSKSANSGLHLNRVQAKFTLQNVNISESTYYGLEAHEHQDLIFSSCSFHDNNYWHVVSSYGTGELDVLSSVFDGATGGLQIQSGNAVVLISGTTFSAMQHPLSIEVTWAAVSFSQFVSNVCSDSGCDCMNIYSYQNISFVGNVVKDNAAGRILHLRSSYNSNPQIEVFGNVFQNNRAATSTSGSNAVLSMTSYSASQWYVNGNEFTNPASGFDMTTYGYSGSDPVEVIVNATNNLFGYPEGAGEAEISTRIFDYHDDSAKPRVAFVPFLPTNYTPICGDNCNGRGACIFPGYCVCELGWSGASCQMPTCQSLDFCNGNGDCISHDTCRCTEGWLGLSCSVANCSDRNSCTGNGFCSAPNACSCYSELGYTGANCDECLSDYRLVEGKCKKCPPCKSGTCDDEAKCVCYPNFECAICDCCKYGYFGDACQPYPFIETVVPNESRDVGGTTLVVKGINLGLANASSVFQCFFEGVATVDATVIADNTLRCVSPSVILTSSSFTTSLYIIVDSSTTFNSIPFTFYGLCPEGQCVNGFCSFGRCQCFQGFRGELCNEAIIAPVFASLPSEPIRFIEGGSFTYPFTLDAGSLPVDFSLMGLPLSGMTISKTGLFTWESPVASSTTVAVWVLATNELSSASAVLYFEVSPSFYVKVSTVAGRLTRPAPVLSFRLETFDLVKGRPVPEKLATLWVHRAGSDSRRKILLKTDADGRGDAMFLPYSSDAGRFMYGGEHPNCDNVTAQGEFVIRGIDVSPTTYNFAGFPMESALLKNVFSFTFYGGTFTNITVTFDEVDGIQANSTLSSYEANETSNVVSLSVNFSIQVPLRDQCYFTLNTNEGVYVSASIALDVRNRSPQLEVSPPNIDIAVARGGVSRYQHIELQNIGSRASDRILLVVPQQSVIRAVTDSPIPGLAVDEKTTITFAFTAAADLKVGMIFTGTVGFVSNTTWIPLDYSVTVVSTVPASLTVITQDEATYFAANAPNLAEVSVLVRSLTVGTKFSALSNGNGTAEFPDLVEDLYEIVAQKLGHNAFRQEIFLAAPGKTVVAFLTTEVVSYTFCVVPVPVLDKYVVEVKTTFDTQVPRPVVIFEPAIFDWEGISSGLVDEIMVTATNYGVIAAQNVTFSWMPYWMNARFILPDEETNPSRFRSLGDLPANSSMTFPVKVERILNFSVPEDRAELRVGTNDALFVSRADDPVWGIGPDIIVAPRALVVIPPTITVEITLTCGSHTWPYVHSWYVPTIGNFLDSLQPAPSLPPLPPSPPSPRSPPNLSCLRCGLGNSLFFALHGFGCTLSARITIDSFAPLPDHVIPSHRAILEGCAVCSADSLKLAFREISNMESDLLAAETALQSCVDAATSDGGINSLFSCIIRRSLGFIRAMPLLSEVVSCQLAQEPCYSNIVLSTNPGLANLLIQARRIQTFTQLALLPFGGFVTGNATRLLNTSTPSSQAANAFGALLINITADASTDKMNISAAELESLLAQGLDLPGDADLRRFATLWNTSLIVWDEDVLDEMNYSQGSFFNLAEAAALMSRFQSSRASVRAEGFTGFAGAWLSAVEGQQFEEARKLAGICATVSVRIEQELTLTRTGFEARLDVSNNGDHPLENVSVALRATLFGNASFDATGFFDFDSPELYQISDVNGTGRIDANSIGKATWLIMPLTEAAPECATKYEISGILLYTIEGIEYQQYLSPDTITVMPDPQLYLTYFHSRIVNSDDPFTNGIVEPAVPFHLGLLIENRGYGEARNVEMVSSQPEIVDNKKGLLVDFNIIGARLGNEPTSKALDINFGNIGARSNEIGVWDMVSSIRGEFFNYSATFQYVGPINDDRLSLIESVKIYELTHLVRVTGDHPAMPPGGLGYYDDELDDFLTNRLLDAFYLPDTVFTSDTSQSNFSVGAIVDRGWTEEPQLVDESIFIVVRHNLSSTDRANLPDWVYVRFDDPMARTSFILQSVTRHDVNYTLIQQYNSWQTSCTEYLLNGSIVHEDYVHLFDFGVADAYTLWYAKQQPVTNLRVVDSSTSSITVAWDAAAGATASYVVVKPSAVSDQYYKVANKFLQIESCVIDGLASGTNYVIKVFTGSNGNYERMGATVTGVTLGEGACGNSVVDVGEECDDGPLNGSPESNCTAACVKKISNTTTFAPSSAPTKPPFLYPTFSPTKSPTDSSTIRPTTFPTKSPADFPTKAPTEAPANSPTRPPTKEPTKPPTRSPSMSPTEGPIFTPTKPPTKPPTKLPITPPTKAPTEVPLKPPSVSPTKGPTKSPTRPPTLPPTKAPHIIPTKTPTNVPTKPPTKLPTNRPTKAPTMAPAKLPTRTPTKQPTKSPTRTPSMRPTKVPTLIPTRTRTKSPTQAPTKPSSNLPTKAPALAPATPPTRPPTKHPTQPPVEAPTVFPTKSPTEPSTNCPTNAPTEAPVKSSTSSPTKQPTKAPTRTPSTSPTKAPTFIPSTPPTEPPTKPPTAGPSKIPTHAPTKPKCVKVTQRCSRFVKCCIGTGLQCVNKQCCYPRNVKCKRTPECCSGRKCKLVVAIGKKRCR